MPDLPPADDSADTNDGCAECGEPLEGDDGPYCEPCHIDLTDQGWLEEAEMYMRAGRYANAAEMYELAIGGGTTTAWEGMVVALLRAGRAKHVLDRVSSDGESAQDPAPLVAQGLALLALGRTEAAVATLREALASGAGEDVRRLEGLARGTSDAGAPAIDPRLAEAEAAYHSGVSNWLRAECCARTANLLRGQGQAAGGGSTVTTGWAEQSGPVPQGPGRSRSVFADLDPAPDLTLETAYLLTSAPSYLVRPQYGKPYVDRYIGSEPITTVAALAEVWPEAGVVIGRAAGAGVRIKALNLGTAWPHRWSPSLEGILCVRAGGSRLAVRALAAEFGKLCGPYTDTLLVIPGEGSVEASYAALEAASSPVANVWRKVTAISRVGGEIAPVVLPEFVGDRLSAILFVGQTATGRLLSEFELHTHVGLLGVALGEFGIKLTRSNLPLQVEVTSLRHER